MFARSTAGTPLHAQIDAFKRVLAGLGWAEGRNLHFEERWADNNADLPGHAMQLARLAPDVIFVVGSPALRAMRRAGPDVPIVFASVADPVEQGFVSSLARPGGNITGFAVAEFGITTKQLDLLKKLAPSLERIAFLEDPTQPAFAGIWSEMETAAPSLATDGLKGAGAQRRGDRTRDRDAGARARQRSLCERDSEQPDDSAVGPAASATGSVSVSLLRRERRTHILWAGCDRPLPPRGALCRSHSPGRKATRSARATADQV
jgi:hypothetical protein